MAIEKQGKIDAILNLNNISDDYVVQTSFIGSNGSPSNANVIYTLQKYQDSNVIRKGYIDWNGDNITDVKFEDMGIVQLKDELYGHTQSLYVTDITDNTLILGTGPDSKTYGKFDWARDISIVGTYLDNGYFKYDHNYNDKGNGANGCTIIPSKEGDKPLVHYSNIAKALGDSNLPRIEFAIDPSDQKFALVVGFDDKNLYLNTYHLDNSNVFSNDGFISQLMDNAFEAMELDLNEDTWDDNHKDNPNVFNLTLTSSGLMYSAKVAIDDLKKIKDQDTFSFQGFTIDQVGNVYISSRFAPGKKHPEDKNPALLVKIPNFGKADPKNWQYVDLKKVTKLKDKSIYSKGCNLEVEGIQALTENQIWVTCSYHEKDKNNKPIDKSKVFCVSF